MKGRTAKRRPRRLWTGRRYKTALASAALASVVLRLRFVIAPISADEGGFLAIARSWRHGGDLYQDVWVDRPQGLLVVYRLFDVLSGGNEDLVRVIALVFGAVAVVAVAELVRLLSTPTAGVIAGACAAVMSSAPAIEGFAANGELLGGTCSAVALALGVAVLVGRLEPRWMFAAGFMGGVGLSMKQSGVDGIVALLAFLVLATVGGWLPRRVAAIRLMQALAGLAAVVLLMALHGLLTGWKDWTYAVYGYRAEKRSAFVGSNWKRLGETWLDAWPILALPVVVAFAALLVVGLKPGFRQSSPSHGLRRGPVVLVLWLAAAGAAFVSGGQFFHHYWVILSLPIAALCGYSLGRLHRVDLSVAVCGAMLLPAMLSWASLVVLPRDRIPIEVSGYGRAVKEERVGQWFADNAAVGETIYVMCASASAYAHADAGPPYPYLWFDNVHSVPGAMELLAAMLAADDRPTYVAEFQRAGSCDWSGRADKSIQRYYRPFAVIDGVRILKVIEQDDHVAVVFSVFANRVR